LEDLKYMGFKVI